MIENNVIAIVQARTGSSRLPNKVIKKILDKPMLILMLERLKEVKEIDKIIVATTELKEDDIIEKIVKSIQIEVFRGSELDCLDRYYKAAKKFNGEIILKITADCPLLDPKIVKKIVKYFLVNKKKFDYVSNVRPPTFPDGMDVEIFTFESLKKAWKDSDKPIEREHTTTYIHSKPEIFRIGNIVNKSDQFSSFRLTVDYEEDFSLVKKIYEELYNKDKIFSLKKIINLLENNPEIKKINSHLICKNAVH